MRLEVTIERLVLSGVAPERARAVAAALEARLAALGEAALAAGAGPAPRDEPFRRLPALRAPAADPELLGERVAEAVWSAVGGER